MRTRLLLLPLAFLAATVSAQIPVAATGTVIDVQTRQPIPGANILLSGTQSGAATDAAGRFEIRSRLEGDQTFVVSAIGYATVTREAEMPGAELDIRLQAIDLGMGEAVVERQDARGWRRLLRDFETQFIGLSRNARRVEILNPEVLDLKMEGQDKMVAIAEAPLRVENQALGYLITFTDLRFSGTADRWGWTGAITYEEMEADDRQRQRWAKARQEAYEGSWPHFARALVRGTVRADGYEVYHGFRPGENVDRTRPLAPEVLAEAIVDPNRPNQPRLRVSGAWQIDYERERDRRSAADGQARPEGQRSWVTISPLGVRFTPDGQVLDPRDVVRYGYWDWERVADLLPLDYTPED